MQKLLILCLLSLGLSGCAKTYTFYCATPLGLVKADGRFSYLVSGAVVLKTEDGQELTSHISNCFGLENKAVK